MKSRKPPRAARRMDVHQGTPMSGEASTIAVSELTGVPLDQLCGWVVIASLHVEGNRHQPVIVPSDAEFARLHLAGLLETVAGDLRLTIGEQS